MLNFASARCTCGCTLLWLSAPSSRRASPGPRSCAATEDLHCDSLQTCAFGCPSLLTSARLPSISRVGPPEIHVLNGRILGREMRSNQVAPKAPRRRCARSSRARRGDPTRAGSEEAHRRTVSEDRALTAALARTNGSSKTKNQEGPQFRNDSVIEQPIEVRALRHLPRRGDGVGHLLAEADEHPLHRRD